MTDEIQVKKNPNPIERVTISEAQKDKLTRLAEQANEAFQGIASVTKSDIVNLLIDEHASALSIPQLNKLKVAHIDQVKYALWMAKRLKLARDAGEKVSIQDLLAQSQVIFCPDIKSNATKRQRKARGKKVTNMAVSEDQLLDPETKLGTL